MQYLIYSYSDIGNVRLNNEDSVLAADTINNDGSNTVIVDAPFLSAVCDGVGGENSGEIASYISVTRLKDINYSSQINMVEAIRNLHQEVLEYGENNPESANLQTTLCCLAVDENDNLKCLNVGDSRLYLHQNGVTEQITTDHTYVQMLFEQGKVTADEINAHPQKNIITSSLGNPLSEPIIDVFDIPQKLSENDVIFICSDGISDYVGELEMEAALSLETSFDEQIKALASLALERGSRDNVSIAAITLKRKEESYNE
ncbi:MAG: serine/threonine-protein phosphatase [Clostridiales bacterium]|nr:serine/threonine-protein phosphatase [Clostridiales bacterium]